MTRAFAGQERAPDAAGRSAARRGYGVVVSAVLAIAALAAAGSVSAQTTSAAIRGRVATAGGAGVADAVVQAQSKANGTLRTAVTRNRGDYRLEGLDPGEWLLVARLPDGNLTDSRTVTLSLGQVVEIDFTAGAGIEETVEVRARSVTMDRRRVGGELRVSGEAVDALPVAGRSPTELALLDSSVRTAPVGNYFGERGSPFVIHGQTGRSNSFVVDGLDNNDQSSGTTLNAFFSQQVIREFVVLTSQYRAEFGRASGGVLNIVTRQGTNEFEGELFLQGTGAGWNDHGRFGDALPRVVASRTTPSRSAFGFRAGGPIRKDRAFFFVAVERQRAEEAIPYTGVDRDGVRGGWVSAPADDDNVFFRTDVRLDDRNFLMMRLSYDDRVTRQLNVGGVFTPEAGFGLEERDVQLAASWKSVLGSSWLNELRVLVGRSSFEQRSNSTRPGVERPSGRFGGNNLEFQEREEDRIQIVENVTWTRGDHTVKFGVDFIRSRTDIATRFNPAGNFLYSTDDAFEPGDCGGFPPSAVDPNDPFAPVPCPGVPGVDDDGDGLIDEPGLWGTYPQVYQFIFGAPSARLDDDRVGAFVQDTWQATPKWLFDFGVRYDLSTFTLPDSARVDVPIPNGGAGRDTDNVAPRFGFTWTPGRGWIVRGGAGVFHDKLVLAFPAVAAITSGTEIGLFLTQAFTANPVTEDVIEALIDDLGPDGFRQLLDGGLPRFPELTLRFSTATELETPYTVQYSAGVERALSRSASARIDVVRSLGYHLPRMRDLNPVVAVEPPCPDGNGGIDPNDLFCPGRTPIHADGTVGSIAAIMTEGRSWYTGVETAVDWRGEEAWASFSYTWSRSDDTGPDPLKGGIYLPPTADDVLEERGPSDFDRRHRVVLSGAANLPWLGLRASIVGQYMSAAPFNVTTGRDENFDGITTDRPRGIARNAGEDAPLAAINALRDEVGLARIERLRAPDFAQVDLRVSRPFEIREGKGGGELYVQVFNVLNRFNGGAVEGRVTVGDFGRPVGYAGPPRTFEVGMRLGW